MTHAPLVATRMPFSHQKQKDRSHQQRKFHGQVAPHSAQTGGINAWHEKARPVSRAGFLPADGVSDHCIER